MDIAKLLVTEIPPLFFFLSTPPMSLSNVSRLGGWLCMFVVLGVLTSPCLHSCSVSTTVATTTTTIIPEVLEPEIKSLRTSLTGSLDHRLELGVLPKSGSTASFHHSSSAHRLAGSSSKFGSIRNIKVSSTLIRAVHFPRNNSIIREEVKSIDSSARLNGDGGGGSVSSPLADHSPGAAAVATAAAAAAPLGVGGGPFPDSTRYRGGRRGAVYRAQHKSSGSTVIDFLKRGECIVRLG